MFVNNIKLEFKRHFSSQITNENITQLSVRLFLLKILTL